MPPGPCNTPRRPWEALSWPTCAPAPSRILVAGMSLAAVAALLYRAVGDAQMLVILLGGALAAWTFAACDDGGGDGDVDVIVIQWQPPDSFGIWDFVIKI